MRLSRDMATFEDDLPVSVKLMGCALGWALKMAMRIGGFVSAPHSDSLSRDTSLWRDDRNIKRTP